MLLALVLAASPVLWLGPPPPLPATRVVTLAPSLTETVLALGAGEALIGVSRFDERPEVQALPRVGGFNDLALEALVALRPQLVVVQKSPGNQKAVETLARLGVSVLALPLTTVGDVAAAMREVGRAVGREDKAAELVAALEAARATERARAAKGPRRRVLFVYGFEPLVVAGPGSFAHELLEDCGVANAAAKAPTAYPTYSVEKAVALVPDVVVDAADLHEGRAALEALKPLRRAKWVTLPGKALLQPGPGLAGALPGLCALLR